MRPAFLNGGARFALKRQYFTEFLATKQGGRYNSGIGQTRYRQMTCIEKHGKSGNASSEMISYTYSGKGTGKYGRME